MSGFVQGGSAFGTSGTSWTFAPTGLVAGNWIVGVAQANAGNGTTPTVTDGSTSCNVRQFVSDPGNSQIAILFEAKIVTGGTRTFTITVPGASVTNSVVSWHEVNGPTAYDASAMQLQATPGVNGCTSGTATPSQAGD